jgi:DNA-directed RNA polymerase subunit M/transcription elongation factor TFIIS
MAREQQIVIKEAILKNNCPECFNQELKVVFYQKHLISRFYNKTTNQVSQEIHCTKCGSLIYPVKWTEDIERSFEYFQKMTTPEPKSLRLTNLAYGLIAFLIVLIGSLSYLYYEGYLTAWL